MVGNLGKYVIRFCGTAPQLNKSFIVTIIGPGGLNKIYNFSFSFHLFKCLYNFNLLPLSCAIIKCINYVQFYIFYDLKTLHYLINY